MNTEDIRNRLMAIKFPATNVEDYARRRTTWYKAQQFLAELDALDKSFNFQSREITIIESDSKIDFLKTLKESGPYYTDLNDNRYCKFGVVHLKDTTTSYLWAYPIESL